MKNLKQQPELNFIELKFKIILTEKNISKEDTLKSNTLKESIKRTAKHNFFTNKAVIFLNCYLNKDTNKETFQIYKDDNTYRNEIYDYIRDIDNNVLSKESEEYLSKFHIDGFYTCK